ncbi:MAG TPA: VOC family protein [Planctomycetota bacterium]|nr:VOC family protein [Planctomycetota bacterium]
METNATPHNAARAARQQLDVLHHVAIAVSDLDATVAWYLERFACSVAYRDATWALLRFQNCDLAFVLPGQHPPHIAVVRDDAERFGDLVTHRDRTRSCYLVDPSSNTVEVCAPDHLDLP